MSVQTSLAALKAAQFPPPAVSFPTFVNFYRLTGSLIFDATGITTAQLTASGVLALRYLGSYYDEDSGVGSKLIFKNEPHITAIAFSNENLVFDNSYGRGVELEIVNNPVLTNVTLSTLYLQGVQDGGLFRFSGNPLLTEITVSGTMTGLDYKAYQCDFSNNALTQNNMQSLVQYLITRYSESPGIGAFLDLRGNGNINSATLNLIEDHYEEADHSQGHAINFMYDGPASITVSGAGTSFVNGDYILSGDQEGKFCYKIGDEYPRLFWNSIGRWEIWNSMNCLYYSEDDVATPDLATTWVAGAGATPVPLVTVYTP